MIDSFQVTQEKTLTHFVICPQQGRGYRQQKMDNAGIPNPDIMRHVKARGGARESGSNDITTSQINCYLTNPPLNALVQAAGGDSKRPLDHRPAWAHVPVPDELIFKYCSFLTVEMEKIRVRKEACCNNFEELKKTKFSWQKVPFLHLSTSLNVQFYSQLHARSIDTGNLPPMNLNHIACEPIFVFPYYSVS